jgi:hypothetical protein
MKLPALKGGAFRKGKYLFQIVSLNSTRKGAICRRAGQKDVPIATVVAPAPARNVFLADQMITSAVLNGKGRLPLS